MFKSKVSVLFLLLLITACGGEAKMRKSVIQVILGSTRKGRSSEKIYKALEPVLAKRQDITAELIDLKNYDLPFLDSEVPPAQVETITDPKVLNWSNTINKADAYIIFVPEYNSGYPGVLKNALDSLYKEWNNKPVAFVGYSGGPSGAANAISQLRDVTKALKMLPVKSEVKIPSEWKALNENGSLVDKNIETQFDHLITELVNNIK